MIVGAADSCVDLAIIGAGYMAAEHLRAFTDLPGVRISGIYSRTLDKSLALAHQFQIPHICRSIADLYEKTRAQVVVIAVSELSVREVCLEAFRYPWICLIEKPAGYNLVDAEVIAAASVQARRQDFVALNRRHYGSTRHVIADLETQHGQRFIHVCDQEDLEAARIFGQPELVIQNWMFANSIHLIDYLQLLGRGEVTNVQQVHRWDPENPAFVVAKVEFSSGDLGLYQSVWNGPGPWAVSVTTQEKRWEMRPLEQAASQMKGTRKLETIMQDNRDVNFKPGLRVQAEELIKAARSLPHTLPSVHEALKSMRLVRAIYPEGK